MNKKIALRTAQRNSTKALENRPSRSSRVAQVHFSPEVASPGHSLPQQVFSSEDQALEFLLSGIVDKLGGSSE